MMIILDICVHAKEHDQNHATANANKESRSHGVLSPFSFFLYLNPGFLVSKKKFFFSFHSSHFFSLVLILVFLYNP